GAPASTVSVELPLQLTATKITTPKTSTVPNAARWACVTHVESMALLTPHGRSAFQDSSHTGHESSCPSRTCAKQSLLATAAEVDCGQAVHVMFGHRQRDPIVAQRGHGRDGNGDVLVVKQVTVLQHKVGHVMSVPIDDQPLDLAYP